MDSCESRRDGEPGNLIVWSPEGMRMMERVGAVKQEVLTPLISETEAVRLFIRHREKERKEELGSDASPCSCCHLTALLI